MITFEQIRERKAKVAVVGLGYVGLPLAVALAEHMDVIGFDISAARVEELQKGIDRTNEMSSQELQNVRVHYSADASCLKDAAIIIVAVPTPIDAHRNPDLNPVLGATRTVAKYLQKDSIVVYESTVYPGLTEEKCVPLLEEISGLAYNKEFFVGYSPERINPGDKVHTLQTIVKIVAASTPEAAVVLEALYGSVVKAGIHKASCIKVAEAAKVIENTQRDLNIALMNELSVIFDKLQIDTQEVLEAAGTKWNFLPFRPGLVGGHCIGVDPYYLTFKAEAMGYHPEVILAGRRINDHMGKYVAECTIKKLIQKKRPVYNARVGILGFTFKENVPDLRNTRVVDVIAELKEYACEVLVHDAMADAQEAMHEYGQELVSLEALQNLDALILAVGHDAYRSLSPVDLRARFAMPEQAVLMDVKAFFAKEAFKKIGMEVWRL